jgi:hypothetical protein
MPRRKSLFPGPKRRSAKMGPLRQNYKGIVPTSTSFGNANARVNVSSRGTRTSVKIPGTNIRMRGSSGTGRRRKAAVAQAGPTGSDVAKKRGCLPGCSPLVLVLLILATAFVLVAA